MFNHNTLEQDIQRLGREIKERNASPEYQQMTEKERVKETIRPLVTQAGSQAASSPQPEDTDSKSVEETVLPGYLKDSPSEIKILVERLIDSVFHEGVEKAVKDASRAGPFILDAFHDALADKLYEELKKRKLI